MSEQIFRLLDFDDQLHHDRFSLAPSPELQLAGSDDWRVELSTLHGGVSEGVLVVEFCNGPITLSVLPTRGMGIWKGRYRELPLEWKSPVCRPVHPAFVNLHDRGGLGWLNGFNELLVRCGLGYQGPPGTDEGQLLTLHGRIANTPAHELTLAVSTAGQGRLTLQGVVDEFTMFGACYRLTSSIVMEAGADSLTIHDRIENIGGVPAPVSLLYHINVGQPFLEGGGGNAVAFREMAPRDARSAEGIDHHAVYDAPTPGFVEQAYYYKPATNAEGWSVAVLHNAARTAGFAVHYDAQQLPYFVVWKNTQSLQEGYVTGLEPAMNFPNFRGYERAQQRQPVLAPGESCAATMHWEFADSAAGVSQQLAEVAELQTGISPRIHRQPQPGWSPAGESTK